MDRLTTYLISNCSKLMTLPEHAAYGALVLEERQRGHPQSRFETSLIVSRSAAIRSYEPCLSGASGAPFTEKLV